jgi:hypothetical protein
MLRHPTKQNATSLGRESPIATEPPAGDNGLAADEARVERTGLPDVSPTWELELIISGAVLVALFQLPALLDHLQQRLTPQATDRMATAIFFATFYGKAMAIALIGTFVVHLASRAYWVGLIGLHSVFPRGIRWDELKQGARAREIYRKRLTTIPASVARADNFCSVLFSFGFLIVIFVALSIVTIGAMSAVSYLIARFAFGGRHASVIWWTIVTLAVLVPVIVASIDRYLGDRIAPGSVTARVLERVIVVSYYTNLIGLYGPIFMTLLTNVRKRVIYPVLAFVFTGLIGYVVVDTLVRNGLLSVNSYDYFAETDQHALDYRYYASQRRDGEILDRIPSIQSDIITDPYVRLFIPYSPDRHNPAIAARCPQLQPLQQRGLQFGPAPSGARVDSAAAVALGCLARLHHVTLNGASLDTLEFRFHTDPATGLKGIVAYLPTAGLPRGKNVITVQPAPRAPTSTSKRPLRPFVIPFWL